MKDGARTGPLTTADVKLAIAEGRVGPSTLLWRKGLDEWTRADALPDFTKAIATQAEIPPPLPQSGGREAANVLTAGILVALPKPAGPWSRYLARYLDGVIVIWLFFLSIIATIIVAPESTYLQFFNEGAASEAVSALGITAVIGGFTALCLHLFGRTPGKAFYRISVSRNPAALSRPSFFGREARAFFSGMGVGIPIIALFTMFHQRGRLMLGKEASYDEGWFQVSQEPISRLRFWLGMLLILINVVLFVGLGVWSIEMDRRAALPQVFANSATDHSAMLPVGWQLDQTLGDQTNPTWVFAKGQDSAAVLGLEQLPAGFDDLVVYTDAIISTFGPDGQNTMKIDFGSCAATTVANVVARRCLGRLVEEGGAAELLTFLDPPRAWRVILLSSAAAPNVMLDRDALVAALVSTVR